MTAQEWAAVEDALPTGWAFLDVQEAQTYADCLITEPWFTARWPGLKKVLVSGDPGGAASSPARGPEGWMRLSKDCLHEKTLLHEMAHIVSDEPEEHGPIFVEAMSFLAEKKLGQR